MALAKFKKTYRRREFTATFEFDGNHFSLTGSYGGGSGAVGDSIVALSPEFAPLERLHLAGESGIPMHALSNSVYRWENGGIRQAADTLRVTPEELAAYITEAPKYQALLNALPEDSAKRVRLLLGADVTAKIEDLFPLHLSAAAIYLGNIPPGAAVRLVKANTKDPAIIEVVDYFKKTLGLKDDAFSKGIRLLFAEHKGMGNRLPDPFAFSKPLKEAFMAKSGAGLLAALQRVAPKLVLIPTPADLGIARNAFVTTVMEEVIEKRLLQKWKDDVDAALVAANAIPEKTHEPKDASPEATPRHVALAKVLGCETDEIDATREPGVLAYGGSEYFVATDAEATAATSNYIKESVWAFNPKFLAKHTGISEKTLSVLQEKCESVNDDIFKLIKDFDAFVSDAVKSDGRGHFLSGWDGKETTVKTEEGTVWFIYQNPSASVVLPEQTSPAPGI